MTETSGHAVSVVTLDRDNYQRWTIEIQDALEGNKLMKYVLGKVAKPEEPAAGDGEFDVKMKKYED